MCGCSDTPCSMSTPAYLFPPGSCACSGTVQFPTDVFEQGPKTLQAVVRAEQYTGNIVVPAVAVNVQHRPCLQLSLDKDSCSYKHLGEAVILSEFLPKCSQFSSVAASSIQSQQAAPRGQLSEDSTQPSATTMLSPA